MGTLPPRLQPSLKETKICNPLPLIGELEQPACLVFQCPTETKVEPFRLCSVSSVHSSLQEGRRKDHDGYQMDTDCHICPSIVVG